MTCALATLVVLMGGIPADEMRAIVADRLARLDKLIVEVSSQTFLAPGAASPLDRQRWTPVSLVFTSRLTIVRPNALVELLTDAPEKGYEPVLHSIVDGRFVSQHVRPNRFGQTTYVVCNYDVECGWHKAHPLLQVFDIHLKDSLIPQLNLLRLFDEYEVELVGAVGDVSRYQVSVPMGEAWTEHYQFDLNTRGTPLHLQARTEPKRENDPRPMTLDMYALATQEVNGAELVSECVTAVWNAYVGDDAWGIDHFQVSAVNVDDSLAKERIVIQPVLRNATLLIAREDGMDEHYVYDEGGNEISKQVTAPPEPADPGNWVSRASQRWRFAIAPMAAALGLTAAAMLAYFTARPRR